MGPLAAQVDSVRAILRRGDGDEEIAWTLEPGDVVTRRAVHDAYAGNRQRGIATSSLISDILVFSSPVQGAQFGYDLHEGPQQDGSFSYTGEGPTGDQKFTRGNLAVRDSGANGRLIRLFQTQGPVATYVGAFTTGDPVYRIARIPGSDGLLRDGIIFTLVPTDADVALLAPAPARQERSARLSEWTPPSHSDVVVAGSDLMIANDRTVSRMEFELQASFGRWLRSRGLRPQRLVLPTATSSVEPDLYVASTGWIVEAKKSTARAYLRTAIGQVLDYAHLAESQDMHVRPMILLPGHPESDLLALMRRLGISTAIQTTEGFEVLEA